MRRNIEPKCERVRELLPDYSVGAASPDVLTIIEDHVRECTDCASELDALNKTGDLLYATSLDPAPDLWNAISANLEPRRAKQGMWDWVGSHRVQFGGMAAAAAVIVMMAFFIHPKASMRVDNGNYLAQHASMSWREPFADKAGLGLMGVAYTEPISEESH